MTLEAIQKSLREHTVPPFVTATFGSVIGTLADYGLSDEEIRGICDHLLRVVRVAKK